MGELLEKTLCKLKKTVKVEFETSTANLRMKMASKKKVDPR